LALAATLFGAWPGAAPQAQVRLPALGDSVSEDFDILAERRMGERIMREVRHDPPTWTTRRCSSTCSRCSTR
jgi:predicted Zn-dependent protease